MTCLLCSAPVATAEAWVGTTCSGCAAPLVACAACVQRLPLPAAATSALEYRHAAQACVRPAS